MRVSVLLILLIRKLAKGQFDLCEYHGCVCDLEESNSISCRGLFFEFLPSLPSSLETLRLDGNHLTALKSRSFEGAKKLSRLIFTNNNLGYIERDAFLGLELLKSMDLSGNYLNSLPKDAFARMLFLKSLNLSRNQLDDASDVVKAVGWTLSSKILDSLDLSWNKFQLSEENYPLPLAKQLSLAGVPVERFQASGFYLKKSQACNQLSCRLIRLKLQHWAVMTSLDVSDCGFDISSGLLESAKGVRDLNIAGNDMTDRNAINLLYQMSSLERLNVSRLKSERMISWDIFLASWRSLDISSLGLAKVKVKFIPENSQLRGLFASRNRIRNFRITKGLQKIQMLDLSHNRMISLPLHSSEQRFEHLQALDLSFNQIREIRSDAFAPYRNLKFLNLRHNEIASISAEAFPVFELAVEKLDLAENNLKMIPTFLLPNLQTLSAYSNQLDKLPDDSLAGLRALAILDMSNNSGLLSSQSNSWLEQLVSLPYLEVLNLSQCGMTSFPSAVLRSLRHLHHLNLSGNALKEPELFDSFPPCLQSLDLSKNRFTHVSNSSFAVDKKSCLELLDMSKNPFYCDCSLMPLKEVVFSSGGQMVIEDIENVDKYFCFAEHNHWRYPLYSFLEVLQPCGVGEGLNILCLVATVFCIMGGMTCATVCCWKLGFLCGRKMSHNIQYFYRPLSTTEDPCPSAV